MGVRRAAAEAAPWTCAASALGLGDNAATLLLYATLLLWLGLMHATTFVGVACLVCLPHPLAASCLAVLAALAALPVSRPFAAWQQRLARFISATAHAYFPVTMTVEDDAAFARGRFVLGLEPHSVLPISTIAFHPGAPGLTPTLGARQRAALASSAIFNVPIVKHLWSWLGLQSVDRRNMRRLLDEDHVVLLIPGGVQECLFMEPNQETIFLRSRFGFVKMAMTTGANLVPVFAFGQSSIFGYARPGPPLFPRGTARLLSRALGFAPMLFWGRWGLPVPYAVPVHVVVGAPIRVQQVAEPSNEEVAAVLERFIAEMEALFARHKAAAGHPDLKLIVL